MTNIEHLLGSLAPFVRDYGAITVMVILTLESLGMPLPGESLLIFASVLAADGSISFLWLLVLAWSGAVVGDNIGYAIGRGLGRNLVLRYGAKIGLNPDRLSKIEVIFARYGPITVAFARFFSVLRQLNGIVAGTLAMDWWRFLAFNALGAALWVLAWSLAGFYLGEHVSKITSIIHGPGLAGVALAVLVMIVLALTFRRSRLLR